MKIFAFLAVATAVMALAAPFEVGIGEVALGARQQCDCCQADICGCRLDGGC